MDVPKSLYESGDPRCFTTTGVLFRIELPPEDGTNRVRFEHTNGAKARLRLVAMLANHSDAPRTITLIGAAAGPNRDAHALAGSVQTRFQSALETRAATRHVIAAEHAYMLCDAVLAPGEAAAGCFDVHASGAGLEFRVLACDPAHHQLGIHAHLTALPGDGGRRGVFPIEPAE